jgi:hypothetical protein
VRCRVKHKRLYAALRGKPRTFTALSLSVALHTESFIQKGQSWISLLTLQAQALNIILASALYYCATIRDYLVYY